MWVRIRQGLKNRNILFAMVICIAVIVWFLSANLKGKEAKEVGTERASSRSSKKSPLNVQVKISNSEEIAPELVVSGISVPSKVVEVKSEFGAKAIYVTDKRGKAIKKGEVIVELDSKDLLEKLARVKALIEQKTMEHAAAVKLSEKNFLSEAKLAESLTALEAAKAEAKSIEIAITETKIRAPFDGKLQDRSVQVGDYVGPQAVVGKVVVLDPLIIEADVTEKYVSSIEPGMAGKAIFPNQEVREGVLEYISPVGEKASRTFKIELKVENPDLALFAGATVKLIIPMKKIGVHEVSPATLMLDAKGELGVKIVDDANNVEFIPVELVKLVSADVNKVYIKGMPEKARVIVVGQGFAIEGEQVTVNEINMKEAGVESDLIVLSAVKQ